MENDAIPFVFRNYHSITHRSDWKRARVDTGKQEATALVQKRQHRNLDYWGDSSDEEKRTDLRYIFEVEMSLLGCKQQKMNG